jgi:hypothetical protein
MNEERIKDWLNSIGCNRGAVRIELHKQSGRHANLYFELDQDFQVFMAADGVDGFVVKEFRSR